MLCLVSRRLGQHHVSSAVPRRAEKMAAAGRMPADTLQTMLRGSTYARCRKVIGVWTFANEKNLATAPGINRALVPNALCLSQLSPKICHLVITGKTPRSHLGATFAGAFPRTGRSRKGSHMRRMRTKAQDNF